MASRGEQSTQDLRPARVLGVDPSLSMGWAVLDGEVLVTHGLLRLDLITGRGALGRRVRECIERTGELIELYRPARLAYELVPMHRSFRSAPACLAYASVVACLEAAAYHAGLPAVGIPAAHMKKLATGRGNARKEGPGGVREAANLRWGDVGSDDVADALWAAYAARGPAGDVRTVGDLLDT